MSTKIVRSLGSYLSAVRVIRRGWHVPASDELWFRAEDLSHRKTRLEPGLYRPRESGKRKSVFNLACLEGELYEEFRRCAPQLSDSRSASVDREWDNYFLMQHHRVPTRLLDWSDGALIALHFAVRDKSRPPATGSIVYVLDPYWLLDELHSHPDRADTIARWKEFVKIYPSFDSDEWERLYLPKEDHTTHKRLLKTPSIPMLWDTPHLTRRVAAQRSRFMIFGSDPSWLAKLFDRKNARLVSITIPAGSISRIRQELRDAGITESVVYPDLDGLGRELKQSWEMRR